MGLFIKNNEKPRKHCVCEVFFLPEKQAENCSKTNGSTHITPIQHPLIYEAISLIGLFRNLMRDYFKAEIFSYAIQKAASKRYPISGSRVNQTE